MLTLLASASRANADNTKEDVINELKARLEALERQNQQLMKMIESGQLSVPAVKDREDPVATVEQDKPDPDGVRKIVREYLKEVETQKKQADDARKAAEEEKGFIVGKDLGMTARWNHGLMLETRDKAFRIHPVGRLQTDWVGVNPTDRVQTGPGGTGQIQDGVDFRRARVGVEGTFWEVFNFWFEPDFLNTANGNAGVINNGGVAAPFNLIFIPANTDLWFEYDKLPVLGTIRAGSIKPAISMEHITSSRFLDYMERSLMFDTFVGGLDNGFQFGMLQYRTFLDQRLGVMNSLTKNSQSVVGSNVGDGEYSYSFRIWGQPWWEHDGRCFMHLGLAVQHRSLDNDAYLYRARLALRNGPAALHTPLLLLNVAGENQTMLCPEFVVVVGPWMLHAEYLTCWQGDALVPAQPLLPNTQTLGNYHTQAGFINIMYFLTGESRPYDRRQGVWTRVVPRENFFHVRGDGRTLLGRGAWQIGARYSFVDLNDTAIKGGVLHSVVFGLNWFTNPNMKWQLNYGIDRRDIPTGNSNGIVQTLGLAHRLDF
jgi:phosphate-selective porin OprO/OprP